MELKEKLFQYKPKEVGGSNASQGFDFQKNWTIVKLLELHSEGKNYLVFSDYYDDVVVLDSDEAPGTADFFQVKKKDSGNWSVSALLAIKKSTDSQSHSILAKLYDHKLRLDDNVRTLNFVSNANLSDKKTIHDSRTVCMANLEGASVEKILEHLMSTFNLKEKPSIKDFLFYIQTDLNPRDSATYILGKLTDFLDTINPQKKYKPSYIKAMYAAIFNEVGKRAAHHEISYGSFEDLRKKKGLARTDFQEMIDAMGATKDYDGFWELVKDRLNSEQESFSVISILKKDWEKYQTLLMDQTNFTHIKLCETIAGLYDVYITNFNQINNIRHYLNWIVEEYQKIDNNKDILFTDSYIRAASLGKLYEQQ